MSVKLTSAARLSEVTKQHLTVALLDPYGQMSTERWKFVEKKLLSLMIKCMRKASDKLMTSFDGAVWFNSVKLIKCNVATTLE